MGSRFLWYLPVGLGSGGYVAVRFSGICRESCMVADTEPPHSPLSAGCAQPWRIRTCSLGLYPPEDLNAGGYRAAAYPGICRIRSTAADTHLLPGPISAGRIECRRIQGRRIPRYLPVALNRGGYELAP